ncbi:precorrin-3B synthase [Pseudotabrizicola sediminis]|uniref:Precorrin-3B synthase n=1 Tax=Pseudotabrizicola sediminis TaxID=2486418 RepID=A0ABY2KNB7_9RHOB|nr:precorrin-3B synthase [Pseudotabrizicola sediminis]TGD42580.1 precorrin-3B synthase [Pseudotabrizicola sediminis]
MTGASEFVVQGWCPGALRPMLSGDGLVVRIRPDAGRLTRTQAAGIAKAARTHGNGLIDLSSRGNVQVRGVTQASHPGLIEDLRALDLIDADAATEARRAIMVTPFADATTSSLARRLAAELTQGPVLPGKFGFAVDTGPAPVLQAVSADIRLERCAAGGLILRCDGVPLGTPVTPQDAAQRAVDLAHWFVAAGGVTAGRGRMAALIARGVRPEQADTAPAPPPSAYGPGLHPMGALVGFEFGQIQAETLAALAALGNVRVTPWRMLLIEGLTALPDRPDLIVAVDDPRRRVIACTGAPGCLQAHAPVRPLARRLADQVPLGKTLHVTGCAKGCAHPGAADITLVATAKGFDRIRQGSAQDLPEAAGLAAAEIESEGLFR